ncbi:MAG TPA: serine hydrolase domain-containing protein [Puia sp.]|nr:serine hydrolase domain-containing protein [Puia sp.]
MKRALYFLLIVLGIRASGQQTDVLVKRLMDMAHVTGLCLGIVRDGKITDVKAYGYKNKPLGQQNDTATCFYAASFSKAVFAYLVMMLVDEGVINLDKPVYAYLPKPIPEYDNYKDLAGDDRWKLLTARECLDHTTGFPNFRWFNPRGNNKLEFFYTPGTHYGYSGEGLVLLQLVVETITGKPLDLLAKEKIFVPFGMRRTSYVWQPAFEDNYAVGHLEDESTIPKKKRNNANAAGSMETTIADFTRFVAAAVQAKGLSGKAWREMISMQVPIRSAHQFPSLDTATTTDNDKIGLGYGLGWGLFTGSKGRMFFKEGHDDGWENFALCMPGTKEAVVVMTNSSNGERIFKEIFEKVAGVTIPWQWERYTPY